MNRFHRLLLLAPGALLLAQPAAHAQKTTPHLGYVYPAGGRQNTKFLVTIGGQYLNLASDVLVSGGGVRAVILKNERQLNKKEQDDLKEALETLLTKRKSGTNLTTAEIAAANEMKRKLTQFGRKPANPALGEFVTLQFSISGDATPGNREVRLRTPLGLSNPLLFRVGQLPEYTKEDWKSLPASKFNPDPKITPHPPEVNVALPAIMNGQIPPGGADRYRFHATEGKSLVVSVSARELIPYLPDAVPGWFQATLGLYDTKGRELAYDDDFRFNPDPVLHYKIPKSGDYVVEIKDSIFRGREDFVYRLAIGELPFITSIFPLGGPAGAQTTVELKGWNLPATKLTLDDINKSPGSFPVSVRTNEYISNVAPFAVSDLPEILERENNNDPALAQAVTLPVIINGRIETSGDDDVFRFEGQAGDEIVAEVTARRLNSPLDSVLKLTDAAGKQLAANDDTEDKGSGLETHHADSYLRATLPTNGTFHIHVGDTQRKGGSEYAYRLRLSPPRPDFELRIVPSSVSLRGGMSTPLTVFALRKDGFTNAIALVLKNAPAGLVLSGGGVPAGLDKSQITLTASPSLGAQSFAMTLEGQATIQGKTLVRPAVPAEDMMQAFAYRHLVTSKELRVVRLDGFLKKANGGKASTPNVPDIKITSPLPVKIPAGGTAKVQLSVPFNKYAGQMQFELHEPPEGISIQKSSRTDDAVEIVLEGDATKAKPGLKGNLIVNIVITRTAPAEKEKKKQAQRSFSPGVLPAIPFQIVPATTEPKSN